MYPRITLDSTSNNYPIGIVTTRSGKVYACTWSKDTELTNDKVLEAWKENKADFEPYNTSTAQYIR